MKTLFVADDNELDLRILRLILLRNPVFNRELYFKDGRSLIDYMRSSLNDAVNLPDVIFLDMNMPGGWQVLEFLKLNLDRMIKPITVYMVSNSVEVNKIQKAMSYNFVREFIPKPIYKDRIVAIAEEVGNSKL